MAASKIFVWDAFSAPTIMCRRPDFRNATEVARYKAMSGSGTPAYYTLPRRKYTAYGYQPTSDKRFTRHGIGFYLRLASYKVWDPYKGTYRTGFLIHPAQSSGTAGCISLIDKYGQIYDFQNRIG